MKALYLSNLRGVPFSSCFQVKTSILLMQSAITSGFQMLKVEFTVSKKTTFSCHSLRTFLTLFTASLGLVETRQKKNKKEKKEQKSLEYPLTKPRLLPSSHSLKEDGEGEQMDSLVCYQCFIMAAPPTVQVGGIVVLPAYT